MTVTAQALIDAQDCSNSQTTYYTAPANTRTIIDKLTATNHTGGAVTVSINIVPSGSAAADSNKLVSALSIAANTIKDFTELQNHILEAGDFISMIAGAGASICIRASGREIT